MKLKEDWDLTLMLQCYIHLLLCKCNWNQLKLYIRAIIHRILLQYVGSYCGFKGTKWGWICKSGDPPATWWSLAPAHTLTGRHPCNDKILGHTQVLVLPGGWNCQQHPPGCAAQWAPPPSPLMGVPMGRHTQAWLPPQGYIPMSPNCLLQQEKQNKQTTWFTD